MRFSIEFTEVYPHPRRKVWKALSERDALGAWLMETDFVLEAGREFTMWCDDGHGGTDVYHCRLLEYEPEKRMLWAWTLDREGTEPPMTVEFVLEPVHGGTKLTIIHSGDRDGTTIEHFRSGWPSKLELLARALSARP